MDFIRMILFNFAEMVGVYNVADLVLDVILVAVVETNSTLTFQDLKHEDVSEEVQVAHLCKKSHSSQK